MTFRNPLTSLDANQITGTFADVHGNMSFAPNWANGSSIIAGLAPARTHQYVTGRLELSGSITPQVGFTSQITVLHGVIAPNDGAHEWAAVDQSGAIILLKVDSGGTLSVAAGTAVVGHVYNLDGFGWQFQ
jgi:hypothetical protein